MGRDEIADRYLAALGVERGDATFDLLSRIVRAHVATFAFTSVGPRLGDDLPLDTSSIFDRIVVRRRGGYCFEHNGLLFEVLEELGYTVRLKLARVIHNLDCHPGLTHRVTVVDVAGGRFLLDVGYGPLGPSDPVPMPDSAVGDDNDALGPTRPFRVVGPREGQFYLQTLVDAEPYSLYRFDLSEYGQADCEIGHFYMHRHPDSVFVTTLVGSLILDGEVRSLRDRDYRVIRRDGESRTFIEDARHLQEVLRRGLGLHVDDEECRHLFDGAVLHEYSRAPTDTEGRSSQPPGLQA